MAIPFEVDVDTGFTQPTTPILSTVAHIQTVGSIDCFYRSDSCKASFRQLNKPGRDNSFTRMAFYPSKDCIADNIRKTSKVTKWFGQQKGRWVAPSPFTLRAIWLTESQA